MRSLGVLSVFLAIGAAAASGPAAPKTKSPPGSVGHVKATAIWRKSQDKFMENRGQWDNRAMFAARSKGFDMWLEDRGIDLDYYRVKGSDRASRRVGQVIRMEFPGGASKLHYAPHNGLGDHNDFITRGRTVRNATSYADVVATSVYPGVDLHAYFDKGAPRYDLVVAPGADPSKIRLRFRGANSVQAFASKLVFGTQIGSRGQGDLFAYQNLNGKRRQVSASFTKVSKDTVALRLGNFDKNRALTIDPTIYGTYYGGDGGFDEVASIVEDLDGGVFMTGYTQAFLFPAIYGPYGYNLIGLQNAFLSKLQGDAYNHVYAAFVGGSIVDAGKFIKLDANGNVYMAGWTFSSDFPGNTRPFTQQLVGSTATAGTFTLTYLTQTTAPIAYNATPAAVSTALNALPALAGNVVSVTSVNGVGLNGAGAYNINLNPSRPFPLTVASTITGSGPYAIAQPHPYFFVLPFKRDVNTVLAPMGNSQTLILGSQYGESVNGFDLQEASLTAPVSILISGTTSNLIPNIPAAFNNTTSGWLAHYSFSLSTLAYTQNWSQYISVNKGDPTYIGGSDFVEGRGAVFDTNGNVYATGTVHYHQNENTSAANSIFLTTPGVFPFGQLIRETDIFARKYGPNGNLIWSGLFGGHGNDFAGGWRLGADGTPEAVGSAVALDVNNNLVITGQSNSFDFPRTHGAYGQNFTDAPNVFVTKISNDGSAILFSTNLQFSAGANSFFMPAGVAVDPSGNSYITGSIYMPPIAGVVPPLISPNPLTTGTPAVPTYECFERTSGSIGNNDTWLVALNPTGSDLVFDSYLSGPLDTWVSAPYINGFGDGWIMGSEESGGLIPGSSALGLPVVKLQGNPPLPTDPVWNDMITPLAFKSYQDTGPDSNALAVTSVTPPPVGNPGLTAWGTWIGTPVLGFVLEARDGFVTKFRPGASVLQGLSFNPVVVPDGLGASTTGTITLGSPAPTGGAAVIVSVISGTGLSFDPNTLTTTTTVNIPAGGTTANFTAYGFPVAADTAVTVQANLNGDLITTGVSVVPWLTKISLDQTTLVGGTTGTGIVTLGFPAPAGGATVTLSASPSTLASFPAFTIPAGQTSAPFSYTSAGVSANTTVNISATLLGLTKSQSVTLKPASLASVSFNPNHVPAGSVATGTVTLNGLAGSALNVNVDSSPHNASFGGLPVTVVIQAQQGSGTFTVNTPLNPTVAQLNVVANMPAQGGNPAGSANTTLFIDSFGLSGFTLDNNEISSGGMANGTVTIAQAAPAGGVVVDITTSNSLIASLPMGGQVTIPAGQTSATFPIQGGFMAQNQTVTIKATRSGKTISQALKVDALVYTVAVNPNDLLGGTPADGTINLATPAPTGGITFSVTGAPAGLLSFVPSSVAIAAGQTTTVDGFGNPITSFVVNTTPVGSPVSANAMATWTDVLGVTSAPVGAEITLEPVAVQSVSFSPSTIPERIGRTTMTITLSGPAPAGGAAVMVHQSLNLLGPAFIFSSPVVIPAGQTTYTVQLTANAVSRTLADTITVTYNGSVSGIVVVTR